MTKSRVKSFAIWGVCALAIGGAYLYLTRTAPTPSAFLEGVTLDAAVQESAQSGKPVLALATADWCPGCQTYKRGALAKAEVNDYIREHFEPVYVNVDHSKADAQRLGVRTIPATIILRDGKEIDRAVGAVGEDELLTWLGKYAAATTGD